MHQSSYLAKAITDLSFLDDEKQLRIFGVLSASENSFYLMLASSFLGANHCICFEDLSSSALANRIDIFNPHIILGTGSTIQKLLEARNKSKNNKIPVHSIEDILSNSSEDYSKNNVSNTSSKAYNSEDILFTLFTSGTTGLPKAIRHTAKRFTQYAEATSKHFFGLNNNSVIFTATDVGWINGHTYAFYGPLLCGSLTIICEELSKVSNPKYLDDILINCGVTCLYTSVTLLRAIRQNFLTDKSLECKNKSFTLERIGSCGEPLANNVGEWAINYFNPERKSIVNTYFQTETGGVITAPRDEDGFNKDYSNVGKPSNFVNIKTAANLLSEEELLKEGIDPNELIITQPWEGIFHSVISDRPVKYFTKKGYFRLHDIGFFDKSNSLLVGGRSDDVINVAGHRVASSEIENTVLQVPGIFESCAVEISDEIMGSSIALFYSAQDTVSEESIRDKIIQNLSEYHQPQYIFKFNNLPKTKSGKIMRRVMRLLAAEGYIDSNSDYSTFTNKDKFLEDASIYSIFWLNRNIEFNKQKKFDLDSFCSSLCLEETRHLVLPALIVMVMEIVGEWHRELNKILKINILLKNNDDLIFNCDLDINESKSIDSIFEEVCNSDLKLESCLSETKTLVISLKHSSEVKTYVCLLRELDSNSFQLGVKVATKHSILKKKLIISKLIDLISNASKNSEQLKVSNISSVSNSQSQLAYYNESKSKDFIETKDSLLRCHKCQANLASINQERKLEGYLLPIIKSDGKKLTFAIYVRAVGNKLFFTLKCHLNLI